MSRYAPSENPEWREAQRAEDRRREDRERFADNSSATLFPLPPAGPSRATKLHAFMKLHGILTHRSPHIDTGEGEPRWLAMLIPDKRADTGEPIPPGWTIADHMAHCARALDEMGFTAYGPGEYSAVRELCAQRKIPFTV